MPPRFRAWAAARPLAARWWWRRRRSGSDTLRQLRSLTILAGVLAALVAAAAALLLTPASAAAARAAGGGCARDRRHRRPVAARRPARGTQEISALSEALNGMLAALERFARCRAPVSGRCLARASHPAHRASRQRRLPGAALAESEAFADLESDIARLGRLVDSLLAVAREDAAVAPSDQLRLADVLAELADDPQLRIEADPDLRVLGDRAALARAIGNLVVNAKLYGPAGEPVSVRVARSGDLARVTVSDLGRGIPAELAEQASTRFWRGPNSAGREGSGLGLALVRATAERHGGRLEIDGAAVSIVLPALRDSSESVAYTAGIATEEG